MKLTPDYELRSDSSAFNALALNYDEQFTNSNLGRMLRRRIWRCLLEHFQPGQHLLDLACGTGEDSIWLLGQGFRITATDGSQAMIDVASHKAHQARIDLEARRMSLEEITQGGLGDETFDGAFSSFGGLNTISNWGSLARSLSQILTPDASLILILMGPWCPWEILWHLLHAEFRTAFRRMSSEPVTASLGDSRIPVWYPSARQLRRELSPWFHHESTESLGVWLPPTYLDHLVRRWPRVFGGLDWLEQKTARMTPSIGDHYLSVFQRRESEQRGGSKAGDLNCKYRRKRSG